MLEIIEQGGPVMIPLLLCSLVSLTIILERSIFWVLIDLRRGAQLAEQVLESCRRGEWDAVRGQAAGTRNRIVAMLVKGVVHRDYAPSKAMESAATDEINKMRRYMGILDTIITVAPLLGILGTVLGIIPSFDMLGTGGLDHPQAVTRGIAQALITTAAGLGIAIFTVFAFNIFNAKIENAAFMLESYATRLEIVLEKAAVDCAPRERNGDETRIAGAA